MPYEPVIKNESIDYLYNAILKIENIEECYKFFEDLCTIHEIEAISQRLHVALMLKSGEKYTEIIKATGASTATISRVNRCLNYGSGGYNLVLDRMCGKTEE